MIEPGLLVVISAPSGGGKTTILRKVLARENGDFRYSISATTRTRRHNEVDGHDYHFIGLPEFRQRQQDGGFVEWAEVHGNYYATPKPAIEAWLQEGRIVFLDLDVDGGLQVKEQFQEKALLIFVKPPSFASLSERLGKRGTETQAEIQKRLQRYPKEIGKAEFYDHEVVNVDVEQTVEEVLNIIKKHSPIAIGGCK